MAKLTGGIETVVDVVREGIMERFRRELKDLLYHTAMEEVERVAKETAEKVTAQIETYHAPDKGKVQLVVMFNSKRLVPTEDN